MRSTNHRREENIWKRIRRHGKESAKENTVTETTRRTGDQESNLTTGDLAPAGETDVDDGTSERPARESQSSVIETGATPAAQPGRSEAPAAQRTSAATASAATALKKEESPEPLFSPEEAKNLHSRWENIQVGFVDEPRRSVEQADQLVAEAIKRLAEVFADERHRLERQWARGDNVSTEDLRIALQRYRGFFARLLSV
jgi:hypothetical protein